MAGADLTPNPLSGRTISLPRMGRALELNLDQCAAARVWWVDPNLMVLWSPKKLPVGQPLQASLDLVGAGTVRVQITVPDGQQPMRAEDGHVTLCRYAPLDQAAARALSTSLLRINPRAFKADYVPPKLPRTPPEAIPPVRKGPSKLQLIAALAGGTTAVIALASFLSI